MATLFLAPATLLGGGSLCLFGLFLFIGPPGLVSFEWSEQWLLAWDVFVSLVFFVQHSTMLRRRFRGRLARHLSPQYHGALYAVASGVALTGVVLLWQPSSILVLSLDGFPRLMMRAVFLLAGAGMAWGAYALGPFDPLGLEAVRTQARDREPPTPQLTIRGPYRWVRHPLYFFSIVMFWSCPDVSVDRLLFNLLWTAWIYCATFLEESDLAWTFGDPYRDYQRTVPRLVPWRFPLNLP